MVLTIKHSNFLRAKVVPGPSQEGRRDNQLVGVSPQLTVVQSNEEDPLDHVIDVELLAYFLL